VRNFLSVLLPDGVNTLTYPADPLDDEQAARLDGEHGSVDPDVVLSTEERFQEFLESKFDPIISLCDASLVRFLGVLLTLFNLAKAITILSTSPHDPGTRITCLLAFGYASSYFVLEGITWSLTMPSNRQVKNIPLESFLPLLQSVDPGDNPFTFPQREPQNANDRGIPLAELRPANIREPEAPRPQAPWNKVVVIMTAILGLVGATMWMLLLSHIWNPPIGAAVITGSALLYVAFRQMLKYVQRFLRSRRAQKQARQENQPHGSGTTRVPRILVFLVLWIWRRSTSANLFSVIWLIAVTSYFTKAFPETEIILPNWMVWLG
jgi:hypothetical protein